MWTNRYAKMENSKASEHYPEAPCYMRTSTPGSMIAWVCYEDNGLELTLGKWAVGPNGPEWLPVEIRQDASNMGIMPMQWWEKTIAPGNNSGYTWLFWGADGWAPAFYHVQKVVIK